MSGFYATLATLGDPDWIRDRERDRRLGEALARQRERTAYEDDVADGILSDPDREPDWNEVGS